MAEKDKKQTPSLTVEDHILLEMRNNTDAVKSMDETLKLILLALKEISQKINMVK